MIELPITRYDLVHIIADKGYAIGAEIGVENGYFSYYLLQHSPLQKLYSIDPYKGRGWYLKDNAACYLCEFGQRSEMLFNTSAEAADRLLARHVILDFVYIDGSHVYPDVRHDLNVWWLMLREGGLLAGHDYIANTRRVEVIPAVDEFVKQQNRELFLTREPYHSFLIYK